VALDVAAGCLETLKLMEGLVEALPYRCFVAGELGEGVGLVCIPGEGSAERGVTKSRREAPEGLRTLVFAPIDPLPSERGLLGNL
jgi:hypothetical protein